MIVAIFLLLLVGLILIGLEVFTPYGIAGVIGGVLILLSAWLAVREAGPVVGSFYALLCLVIAMAVLRYLTTKGRQSMVLKPARPKAPPEIKSAASAASDPAAGEQARVVQPLRPTGTIEWRGHRFSARSLTPEIETPIGATVIITGRDSIYFLVEERAE